MNTRPPITTITQEHINWWNSLPELWQKIFCVALYHPEKMDMHYSEPNFFYGDEKMGFDNYGEFFLNYSNPKLQSNDDLVQLFTIKKIVVMASFNPSASDDELVTNVPSLRFFHQLELLFFNNQRLKDIMGLANVTSLKYLIMSESLATENIQAITTLKNLQVLDLSFNSVTDLTGFENLTQLLSLDLACNYITDVSPVANLTNLTHLNLGDNPIQDLSPLFNLTQLQELEVGTESSFGELAFANHQIAGLKYRLANTKIDVWGVHSSSITQRQLMSKIANEGLAKIDDDIEKAIHDFVEKNQDNQDPAIKQLVDSVVKQYEKATMYLMFDNYTKQKAEPIITLNQQLHRKKHASIAHILQDELSKRNLKQSFATALSLKQNIALYDFLQILDKLDLEIIVREKLQTPEKSPRLPLLQPKPSEVVTEITQEHIDWWHNLPELWQKIFCVALYEPKKIARHFVDDYSTEWYYDDTKDNDDYGIDDGSYILGYSPVLRQQNDLLELFKVKQILYFQEVNPSIDEVVTFIPPMHYFTDLEILSIDSNYLEDISNLASLTTLQSLWLNECFTIEDCTPISHLTNLIELKLGFNNINNIEFIKTLSNLKNLFLCGNLIEDVIPLANLTNLVSIDLSSNPIKDVRPLAHLTNLKELELGTDKPASQGGLDDFYLEWLREQLPNTDIMVW